MEIYTHLFSELELICQKYTYHIRIRHNDIYEVYPLVAGMPEEEVIQLFEKGTVFEHEDFLEVQGVLRGSNRQLRNAIFSELSDGRVIIDKEFVELNIGDGLSVLSIGSPSLTDPDGAVFVPGGVPVEACFQVFPIKFTSKPFDLDILGDWLDATSPE